MIILPPTYDNGPFTEEFKKWIDFFNKLEEDMRYPNSEGYADQRRVLDRAMNELIKRGKL